MALLGSHRIAHRFVIGAAAGAALALAMLACGGAPLGYRSKTAQPWKHPRILELDEEGEAEFDGAIDFERQKRAQWLAVDLPGPGTLKVRLGVLPGDGARSDLDVAFEVLDASYHVLTRADADEDDAGDLNKSRSLDDLRGGRYYIHVYLQKFEDRADVNVRAQFQPGKAAYESTFPSQVAFVGVLPAVPLFDDAPVRRPPPKRAPRRRPKPEEKPSTSIRARIAGITTTGKGTRIKIDRGSSSGIQKGWRGKVVTRKGAAIQDGSFVVDSVTSSESFALVRATQDAVTSAKYVRLSPP